MSKIDVTTKLATTEASLKRWQTRLKRAATKVHALDKQRLRLSLLLIRESNQPGVFELPASTLTEVIATVTKPKAASDLAVPAFLDRADPHIAAKMTAARKAKEAEQRKQMPLTGRAALAKIKERK